MATGNQPADAKNYTARRRVPDDRVTRRFVAKITESFFDEIEAWLDTVGQPRAAAIEAWWSEEKRRIARGEGTFGCSTRPEAE